MPFEMRCPDIIKNLAAEEATVSRWRMEMGRGIMGAERERESTKAGNSEKMEGRGSQTGSEIEDDVGVYQSTGLLLYCFLIFATRGHTRPGQL